MIVTFGSTLELIVVNPVGVGGYWVNTSPENSAAHITVSMIIVGEASRGKKEEDERTC